MPGYDRSDAPLAGKPQGEGIIVEFGDRAGIAHVEHRAASLDVEITSGGVTVDDDGGDQVAAAFARALANLCR